MKQDPLEAHRRSLEEQSSPAPWYARLEQGSASQQLYEAASPGLKARFDRRKGNPMRRAFVWFAGLLPFPSLAVAGGSDWNLRKAAACRCPR